MWYAFVFWCETEMWITTTIHNRQTTTTCRRERKIYFPIHEINKTMKQQIFICLNCAKQFFGSSSNWTKKKYGRTQTAAPTKIAYVYTKLISVHIALLYMPWMRFLPYVLWKKKHLCFIGWCSVFSLENFLLAFLAHRFHYFA